MIKRIITTGIFAALIIQLFLGVSGAKGEEQKNPAFDRIKTLSGQWKGRDEDDEPAKLNYEITSGGTAVLEKLAPGEYPPMVSVYHRDNTNVMMTHYCNANNQPRMRLKSYDEKDGVLEFDFVDVTNLKKPEEGHMRRLTLKIVDKNHLEHAWTWKENGQEKTAKFSFTRASNN